MTYEEQCWNDVVNAIEKSKRTMSEQFLHLNCIKNDSIYRTIIDRLISLGHKVTIGRNLDADAIFVYWSYNSD
jgi:hypothetical protein